MTGKDDMNKRRRVSAVLGSAGMLGFSLGVSLYVMGLDGFVVLCVSAALAMGAIWNDWKAC